MISKDEISDNIVAYNLKIHLPKTMFLEIRNCGEKCIINIKNPSIFTITLQCATATAQVESDFFQGPL